MKISSCVCPSLVGLQDPIQCAGSSNMDNRQFLDAVSLSLSIKCVIDCADTDIPAGNERQTHQTHCLCLDNRRRRCCCCCIFQMRTSFESHFSLSFFLSVIYSFASLLLFFAACHIIHLCLYVFYFFIVVIIFFSVDECLVNWICRINLLF